MALKKYILNLETTINSICRTCKFRGLCNWCPGRAFLEKKDISKPISYFCILAKEKFKNYNLNQAKV